VYEPYDNQIGGYTSMRLEKGDILEFTVTSQGFLDIDTETLELISPFPRTFTLKSLVFPIQDGMLNWNIPGASPDTPIELTAGLLSAMAPVNVNSVNWNEGIKWDTNMTWFKFVAPSTGLADFNVEEYQIYVFKAEVGEADPQSVRMSDNGNNHKFVVKSGITYFVGLPNTRPRAATLSFTAMTEGESCALPIDLTGNTTIDIKAGSTWYTYATENVFVNNLLALQSNSAWTGSIEFHNGCFDAEPKVIKVVAGENSKSHTEIFKEKVVPELPNPIYTICIKSDIASTSGLVFTQRPSTTNEACITPAIAVKGTNTFTGEKRAFWYRYKATKDCQLFVTGVNKANLILVTTGCTGTDNTIVYVENNAANFRLQPNEEVNIKLLPTGLNEKVTFNIEERTITPGDYCDHAIPFALGERLSLPNHDKRLDFYSFIPAKDGRAEFSTSNQYWINGGWTLAIIEDCGSSIQNEMKFTDLNGTRTYHYPVVKGKEYRFSLYQLYTGENGAGKPGNNVVIKTQLVDFAQGESCSNPIALNFNENAIRANEANIIWYEFKAPKAGKYSIVAVLGSGAVLTTKLDNCEAEEVRATIPNYNGYGRYYQKLDLTANQVVKISTEVSTVAEREDPTNRDYQAYDYALIAREAAPGDALDMPLPVAKNTTYKVSMGDVNSFAEGFYYEYTPSTDGLTYSFIPNAPFYYGSPSLYYDGAQVYDQVRAEKVNEDGTTTYTFTYPAVAGKKCIIDFCFEPGIFAIGSTPVGIDKNETANAVTIYPNPTDGNFEIALGELSAQGATIEVIDMTGKTIYQDKTTASIASIHLNAISAGTYFVKITTDTVSAVRKLVIR
ncbi:MAG: T9SS type A sorting domain-containing protein, partial [Bacteroidaceae bacterium]